MSEQNRKKDDVQPPILEVAADEKTRGLQAKIGKVVWSLAELEVVLPEEAAQKVKALTQRVAEELCAIIRETGNFKRL